MQQPHSADDSSAPTRAGAVLLVHGLWTNRAVMLYLARALAGHGFRPHPVGYFSALDEFEHNAARVARAIAECPDERLDLVAHSLGGLVALRALARRPDARVRRVVLLGVPLVDCHSGRAIARMRLLAPLLGTTRSLWSDMPQLDVPAGVAAGAIAGTRRLGLGSIVLRLPGPNDGVVRVEETRHPSLADHLLMPVAHSEMLVSRAVAAQAAAFLASGRFAR
jgi:pimeloyl-ACP methyl ester carboxylesterase